MADNKFRRVGTVVKVEGVDGWPNLFRIQLSTEDGDRTCSYSINPKKDAPASPERIAALGVAQTAQVTQQLVVISGYTTEKTNDGKTTTFYNGQAIRLLTDWEAEHPGESPNKEPNSESTPQTNAASKDAASRSVAATHQQRDNDNGFTSIHSESQWALSTILGNLNHFADVPTDPVQRADWLSKKAVSLVRMSREVTQTVRAKTDEHPRMPDLSAPNNAPRDTGDAPAENAW
jgi:hypothetical protein